MKSLLKNIICILLCIAVFSNVNLQQISARSLYVELDQPRTGIVTKMIDTEAVEVMYYSTLSTIPTIERLRLVGVDSMGNKDSFEYSKNQLLGKTVFVLYDDILDVEDGFIPSYVYISLEQSFNETLLQNGYGILETADSDAEFYTDLLKAEQIAKRQELNLWQTESTPVNKININMASLTTLTDHLDLSTEDAYTLINYRTNNPINGVEELGFVLPVFTRDYLQSTGRSIHVITDLNSANLYELDSLFSTFSGLSNAYALNDYRIYKKIASIGEIQTLLSLNTSEYTKLNTYATVEPNTNHYDETNKIRANINTASASEIVKASGMTQTLADKIVNIRTSYPEQFRDLQSLYYRYPTVFSSTMTYYTDDLTVATEINSANIDELKSLFTRSQISDTLKTQLAQKIIDYRPFYDYSKLEQTVGFAFYKYIRSYIYIDGVTKDEVAPININTASKAKIISYLGLTGTNATNLQSRNGKFYSYGDVFFLNSTNASKITLYTNINTASEAELLLLSSSMTQRLAKKIIAYRIEYPFYNINDLKTFFENEDQSTLYTLIKDYVVYY